MYSRQKAAAILGRSEDTIRRWMKQYGIKKVLVETDRKRVYIADDDMNTLVDHIYQRVTKNDEKRDRNRREVITIGEGKYYSFTSTAALLGVSVGSVKRWIRQDNVEKKRIMTDKKRVYISSDDVLRIAERHMYKVPSKLYVDTDIERAFNTTENDIDELISIKEVALYLDTSQNTVRVWIRQANIEIKKKFSVRGIWCITYGDVVRLAELHNCSIVTNPSALTVVEEVKQMKGKIEKLAADIEDIKHDFRLYVKRNSYR